jgi:histidine triad (HIT) family protein
MDCLFCKIIAGEIPAHKVYENENSFAFLDIRPASRGHTLVVPREHSRDLYEIGVESLGSTLASVQSVAHILRSKLRPDGLSVYQNNGEAAGQTIFHFHVHLVPRWEGVQASLHRPGETDHGALAALAEELRRE